MRLSAGQFEMQPPSRVRAPESSRGYRHVWRWLSIVSVFWLVLQHALAQEGFISREHQIKAAYLYNFAKYVSWPAEGRPAEFRIGIVGNSPVADLLAASVRDKKLNDKLIVVQRIATAQDYVPCEIVFIPAGQASEAVAAVREKTRGLPILIVGEEDNFAQRGGMINFYLENNTVKFEINPKAAERARLKISSKLLSLGRIVGGN